MLYRFFRFLIRWAARGGRLALPLLVLAAQAQPRLGINTPAPTQELDVNGRLRLRGLGSPSVMTGYDQRLPLAQPDGTLGLSEPPYTTSVQVLRSVALNGVPGTPTGTAPNDLALSASGTTAYVVSDAGLEIFSLSNPAAPLLLSTSPTPASGGPGRVAVAGNLVCVVSEIASVLQVFDVSNPAAPVQRNVGGTPTAPSPRGLALNASGTLAYVLCGTGVGTSPRIMVVDLSNPASPVELSSTGTINYPGEIMVRGSTAYVAFGAPNHAVYAYDLSDPIYPSQQGGAYLPFWPRHMATNANGRVLGVVSAASYVLYFLDISSPQSPALRSTLPGTGADHPYGIDMIGDLAFVSYDGSSRLRVYDVANPAAPVLLQTLSTGFTPYDVAASANSNLVCVINSGSNTLQVFALATGPARPLAVNADGTLGTASPLLLSTNSFNLSLSGLVPAGASSPSTVALPTQALSYDATAKTLRLGSGTAVAAADNLGSGGATAALRLADYELRLRGGSTTNYGLGWYGTTAPNRPWASLNVDGPALYGTQGGLLATKAGGARAVLRWTASGYVGIGTGLGSGANAATPLLRLDADGALATRPATTALTADNQAVAVGNRSYLRLSSNTNVPTDRSIVLEAGQVAGQLLLLENAGTTGAFEVVDFVNNVNLVSTHSLDATDTLRLVWNGSTWLEIAYSHN